MSSFRKYEVRAANIEDFLARFTKHERHFGRGADYVKERIKSYENEFKNMGFCFMSRHESITGEIVSYYGRSANEL